MTNQCIIMEGGEHGPLDNGYFLNTKAKLLGALLIFSGFPSENVFPRDCQYLAQVKAGLDPVMNSDLIKVFSDLCSWLSRNGLLYQMARAPAGKLQKIDSNSLFK